MTINWFSPLPPARTEIARFTARLLPALAEKAAVRLWTDQTKYDRSLSEWAEIVPYSGEAIDWPALNLSGPCFFNLGNDWRFHSRIWEICNQHAGIVILHDPCLLAFFSDYYRLVIRSAEAWVQFMESAFGVQGRNDALGLWTGALDVDLMAEQYPCTAIPLASAVAGLVHSKRLAASLGSAGACPLFAAALPWQAHGKPGRRTPGPPWRFVLFGHGGRNRCVDAVLEALSDIPESEPFQLDIYGEIGNYAGQLMRSRAILARKVRIHGFVSEAELDDALRSAHLAFNLRFPTMGETSAGLLRTWSHGLPTIVSQAGWYATVPAGTVLYARTDNPVADIRAHVLQLQRTPDAYFAVGARGYDHLVTEYSTVAYRDVIVRIAENFRELSRGAGRLLLGGALGSRMSRWLPETLAESCADALATRVVSVMSGRQSSSGAPEI